MDDIFVDLRAAGLPTPSSSQGREDLAAQLGYSYKHLDNVMFGRKPYGGKLKVTIQKLVSLKEAIEECEQTRPAALSPLNKAEPVEQDIIDQADEAVEPAESLLDQHVRKATDEARLANQVDPRIYKVFTDPDGRAVVTKVIARFTRHRDADAYVLFLNDQIRRGKETD